MAAALSPAAQELAESLTTGCRILAEQDVLDAYGHLSARLPDGTGFVISRGMSPALVTPRDFLVLDSSGTVVQGEGIPNVEWPIHAMAYEARSDVHSVLHSHSRLSRIFSLSSTPLRGILTSSVPEWGHGVPVYRSAGLVTSVDLGATVAATLGRSTALLLRGHGDVVVGSDVAATVLRSITLRQNADILNEVLQQGSSVDYWTDEESAGWHGGERTTTTPGVIPPVNRRAWDYYVARSNGSLARLFHD